MINWKFGIMESNIRTYKKLYFYKFGKLPKYVLGFLRWLKNNNYIICSEGFNSEEFEYASKLLNDRSNLYLEKKL